MIRLFFVLRVARFVQSNRSLIVVFIIRIIKLQKSRIWKIRRFYLWSLVLTEKLCNFYNICEMKFKLYRKKYSSYNNLLILYGFRIKSIYLSFWRVWGFWRRRRRRGWEGNQQIPEWYKLCFQVKVSMFGISLVFFLLKISFKGRI